MKNSAYLLILLFVAGMLSACKKDKIEYNSDFEKSVKAWSSFKESSNNSYRYTRTTSSWTGSSSETVITVSKGQITGRSFVAKSYTGQNGDVAISEQWEEDSTSLNSHRNGSALLTLDEIYQLAKTDLLLKRAGSTTYFEARNGGMISSCGYVDDNCADDCFNGITISSIEKL